MRYISTLLLPFFIFLSLIDINDSYAQSTYAGVYSILQTNCGGCHNSNTYSGQLDLSGTESQVYDNLVNKNPVNPAALAKGDKLITPGYPDRSFLIRKCNNNNWDPSYTLDIAEGAMMPENPQTPLSNVELEKIRQWVLFGAPKTGVVIQDSTLNRFYGGLGMVAPPIPLAPLPSEGMQVRLGRVFQEPGTEVEYFKKHDLRLPDSLEVNRVEVFMNTQSHHYIIYKFNSGVAGNFPEGLRKPNQNPSGNATTFVTSVQFSYNSLLPDGTAFVWPQGTVLDLNYHILNYSQDSVLAADAYANIYTQPKGTAQAEMHSDLVLFSGSFNPQIFNIPSDSVEKTFTDPYFKANSNDEMNIWLLTSHTHKWGKDYDIYKRNPNGTKGDQIYEGFYNVDYTFNQGYYDFSHPSIRLFDPMETIKMSEGLIHEAKFRNTGTSPAYFGLTTEDEMMLFIVQYTLNWNGLETGKTEHKNEDKLDIYPNPYHNSTNIVYSLQHSSEIILEVFNILGNKVYTLVQKEQPAGDYRYNFSAKGLGLSGGVYIVNFTVNGSTISKKVVELN